MCGHTKRACIRESARKWKWKRIKNAQADITDLDKQKFFFPPKKKKKTHSKELQDFLSLADFSRIKQLAKTR